MQVQVKLATGGWLPGAVIVMVRVAVPVAPCGSFAVSVIVCVPTESVVFVSDAPVPNAPSRLLVHTSAAPARAPLSGSVALPGKVTLAPCANVALVAGAVIVAVGG